MECKICLSDIEDENTGVLTTCCQQLYHEACLNDWIDTSPTCPICKRNIDSDSSIPLFRISAKLKDLSESPTHSELVQIVIADKNHDIAPDMVVVIEKTVEANPNITYKAFRSEFEDSHGRQPSRFEIGLFSRTRDRYLRIQNQCRLNENGSDQIQKALASAAFNVDLPHTLLPTRVGGVTITGMHCQFDACDRDRTAYLNAPIKEGIWRWTVRTVYGTGDGEEESFLAIGATPSDFVTYNEDITLGDVSTSGACAFQFSRNICTGKGVSTMHGVKTTRGWRSGETRVPFNNALVAVEANTKAHTLHFFVNNEMVPRAVSHVPVSSVLPIYLGISGVHSSFASVSLRRLSAPSSSPVACVFYECQPREED